MSTTTHTHSFTRRGALLALVGTLMLGAGATEAQAQSPLDFTFKNRLGVTIRSIHVSPHGSDSWEEDVLKDNVLGDGRDVRIRFNSTDQNRGDVWDIMIVTSDGEKFIWKDPGFNLRKISEIKTFVKGGQVTAESK
jgi:hypothetical protein